MENPNSHTTPAPQKGRAQKELQVWQRPKMSPPPIARGPTEAQNDRVTPLSNSGIGVGEKGGRTGGGAGGQGSFEGDSARDSDFGTV